MSSAFDRTRKLIGDEGLQRLFASKTLVVGVGGVGGYAVEMLARAGVGEIGIMDGDVVDITNLNRQMIALYSTVGESKVEAFRKRIEDINPECNVVAVCERFSLQNSGILDRDWDFVIDAIDSFEDKVDLICLAKEKGLNIVSAMGAGNRAANCVFEICDIYRTSYDALAKKLRKALRDRGVKSLDVCYTKAQAISTTGGVGSMSFVPPMCGITIAGYVIERLLSD